MDGCLKFYSPPDLIGIYAEIKETTYKQYTDLFVKCKLRAERQACATDLFFIVVVLIFCKFRALV